MQYTPRKQYSRHGINITPLIDIVFLLLVFFMLTSHFINERQFEIDLPTAKSSQENSTDKSRRISINSAGDYYQGEKRLQPEQLSELFAQMAQSEQTLILDVDKQAPFEPVMALMDQARQRGVLAVGFSVQPPKESL